MALGFDVNGNQIPDIDPEWGLDSILVYEVESRAYSYPGQEMYHPEYGIDLLRFEGLEKRARASLSQIHGYRLNRLRVRQEAPTLIVDALLRSQL